MSISSAKSGLIDDSILVGNVAVPPAPTATAGINSASVAFSSVAGATSYTVISTPGSFTATGASSPLVVTGLTGGSSYTFQLSVTTSAGTSGYSQPSNSVTAIATTAELTYWYPGTAGTSILSSSGQGQLKLSGSNLINTYYWNGTTVLTAVSTTGTEAWTFRANNSDPYFSSGICTDSSGNIYGAGYYLAGGNAFQYVTKFNTSGVLQWQVARGRVSGSAVEPVGIATDGTNVYVTGYDIGSGNGNGDGFVTTWACSNGAFQQHRTIRNPGAPLSTFLGKSEFYGGSFYVIPSAGYSAPSGRVPGIQLQQFSQSSTPSYVSTYQIDNATGGNSIDNKTFAIDGSGNFYFGGITYAPTINGRACYALVKMPTALNTINYARAYGTTLGNLDGTMSNYFSNGFLYVQTALGYISDSKYRMIILKIDPANGDIVWARSFTTGQNQSACLGLYATSTNVYALNLMSGLTGLFNTAGIYNVLENGGGAGGTYTYGGATWTYSDVTSTFSTVNMSFSISNPTFSTSTSTGLSIVGSPAYTWTTSAAGSYTEVGF
jgi:hypothetical protein